MSLISSIVTAYENAIKAKTDPIEAIRNVVSGLSKI